MIVAWYAHTSWLVGTSTLRSTVSVHISPTVQAEEVFSKTFLGVDKFVPRAENAHIDPVYEALHLYFVSAAVLSSIAVFAIE